MKATPEDVAKTVNKLNFRQHCSASMKATPEDVAKSSPSTVAVSPTETASMKATPEDVAKEDTAFTQGGPWKPQ